MHWGAFVIHTNNFPFQYFSSVIFLCFWVKFLCLSSIYDLIFCVLNPVFSKIDLNSAIAFLSQPFFNSAVFFLLLCLILSPFIS